MTPRSDDDATPASCTLQRALHMSDGAARHGFDWQHAADVLDKIDEELGELRGALAANGPDRRDAIRDELGDLLFALVNLARKLDVDPSQALASTMAKFQRRYAHMERVLAEQGRTVDGTSLAELDHLWNDAKRLETPPPRSHAHDRIE